MTYLEFIKLSDSTKKILFEIDRSVILNGSIWIKEETNIWKTTYAWDNKRTVTGGWGTSDWGFGPYGQIAADYPLPTSPHDIALKVSSVLADSVQLTEVTNFSDLRSTVNSFLWVSSTQILYIHTNTGVSPEYDYQTVGLGVTKGYANHAGYYGALYYEGRVKSVPSISNQRDSLYYGKISFEGGSVSLINIDGAFDGFGDSDYYGAEVRLLFGGDDIDYSEYKVLYTGYVENYGFDSETITINFKDNRKLLSKKISDNLFSKSVYASLDYGDDGTPIPLGYGKVNKGIAYCINQSQEEVSTYNFKFIDTTHRQIKSIESVYVNNKPVTFTSPSTTDGTFSLAGWDGSEYTVYEPGDDVSVTYEGYLKDDLVTLLDNPVEVIQDILTTHTSIVYNSAFFNLTEWEQAKLDFTSPIGLLIQEEKEIIDIIGEISSSIFGLFIIQGDGKITFKKSSPDLASVDRITIDQFTVPATVDFPSGEYLNSVKVNYSQIWQEEKYRSYTNTDKQDELFRKYKANVQQSFNTVLSDEVDAIAYSNKVLDTFGGIFPTYDITTKTQNVDLVIGDNIDLQIEKTTDDLGIGKYIKAEVLGTTLDLNSFTVQLKLRFVDYVDTDVNLIKVTRYKIKE